MTIELKAGRDDGILAWLEGQRNWSEAIRAALRAHLCRQRVTLETVYEELKRLEGLIAGGDGRDGPRDRSASPYGDAPGTETAAENLSRLGL